MRYVVWPYFSVSIALINHFRYLLPNLLKQKIWTVSSVEKINKDPIFVDAVEVCAIL